MEVKLGSRILVKIGGGEILAPNTLQGLVNNGLIEVSLSADLNITGNLTGQGNSIIRQGASLHLSGDAASAQTVSFDKSFATLELGQPDGFDGKLAGFSKGDILDLDDAIATNVTVAGTQLTVNLQAGGPLQFTLAQPVNQNALLFGSDGESGTKIIYGNLVNDSNRANVMKGTGYYDIFNGRGGNDRISGATGDDVLTGGLGRDLLNGGVGSDRFDFNALKESAGKNTDTIQGFAAGDLIDLRDIDANLFVAGNDAFSFIGDEAFHSIAGELRFSVQSGFLLVQGDVNGDAIADFQVKLTGATSLAGTEFLL